MTHSIRLRLIDWLQCVVDQLSKDVPDGLRRHNVHAQSARNIHEWPACPVNNDRPEGEAYRAVNHSVFGEDINIRNGDVAIPNLERGLANYQFAPGLNDHLVISHNSPLLGEMNSRSLGLAKESRAVGGNGGEA